MFGLNYLVKMRNSLFSPPTGYLVLGKIFRNHTAPVIVRQSSRQYGRSSTTVKSSQLLGNCNVNISNRIVLDFSNKNVIGYYGKRFCSGFQKPTSLMDFRVATNPTIFYFLKMTILEFIIFRSVDKEFSLVEFKNNSVKAVEVVTNMLAELRFNDLEGLLTDECREEVQRNVRALEPEKRYKLAVNPKDIVYYFPYDLNIIKDGNDNEKTFLEVTMGYHISKGIKKDHGGFVPRLMSHEELATFTIYNCRFIKECTEGVYDQWTINAINVCFLQEYLPRF